MNISFFIPAYNCAQTIEESVESILDGNLSEGDEIVIINDGSTDQTEDVIKRLASKYSFIRHISHPRNKGGASARNTAIENCKHDLLFCLDSDNVLEKNSIPALRNTLLENSYDVVAFHYRYIFVNSTKNVLNKFKYTEGINSKELHFSSDLIPGQNGNYLFTRSSWLKAGGYTEGTGAMDTWIFGVKQALTGSRIFVSAGSYYYHRIHDNSYWNREAERNKWKLSLIFTQALIPYFDLLDEKFINYILTYGRYNWIYNLNDRPIVLSKKDKSGFYTKIDRKLNKQVYNELNLLEKLARRIALKRII